MSLPIQKYPAILWRHQRPSLSHQCILCFQLDSIAWVWGISPSICFQIMHLIVHCQSTILDHRLSIELCLRPRQWTFIPRLTAQIQLAAPSAWTHHHHMMTFLALLHRPLRIDHRWTAALILVLGKFRLISLIFKYASHAQTDRFDAANVIVMNIFFLFFALKAYGYAHFTLFLGRNFYGSTQWLRIECQWLGHFLETSRTHISFHTPHSIKRSLENVNIRSNFGENRSSTEQTTVYLEYLKFFNENLNPKMTILILLYFRYFFYFSSNFSLVCKQ